MGYETKKQEAPEGFTHLGENTPFCEGLAAGLNENEEKFYYPELHFEGEHAAHLIKHLAANGKATIFYKKISESTHHDTRDGKEKTRHRVGIQIHAIKPDKEVEAPGHSSHDKESPAEDAIEKGLEAAETESN